MLTLKRPRGFYAALKFIAKTILDNDEVGVIKFAGSIAKRLDVDELVGLSRAIDLLTEPRPLNHREAANVRVFIEHAAAEGAVEHYARQIGRTRYVA